METKPTPEQERARIIAELKALPVQPLKPIPPDVMAEIMEDQIPYEQAEQEYRELMEKGGHSIEPYLLELKAKLANRK
jgi:hypothetical protein